jgi:hypothetical protein
MLARKPLTSRRIPDRRVKRPAATGSGEESVLCIAVTRELIREN